MSGQVRRLVQLVVWPVYSGRLCVCSTFCSKTAYAASACEPVETIFAGLQEACRFTCSMSLPHCCVQLLHLCLGSWSVCTCRFGGWPHFQQLLSACHPIAARAGLPLEAVPLRWLVDQGLTPVVTPAAWAGASSSSSNTGRGAGSGGSGGVSCQRTWGATFGRWYGDVRGRKGLVEKVFGRGRERSFLREEDVAVLARWVDGK